MKNVIVYYILIWIKLGTKYTKLNKLVSFLYIIRILSLYSAIYTLAHRMIVPKVGWISNTELDLFQKLNILLHFGDLLILGEYYNSGIIILDYLRLSLAGTI